MVDASARLKGVDAVDLLAKCKRFLGGGWDDVNEDNFDLQVLT